LSQSQPNCQRGKLIPVACDGLGVSVEVGHLTDVSVIEFDEAGVLFIDWLAGDGAAGVVAGDDYVSVETVHGGVDQLDRNVPALAWTSRPRPRRNPSGLWNTPARRNDPGVVEFTSGGEHLTDGVQIPYGGQRRTTRERPACLRLRG
jgi:hypothetical protein